MVHEHAPVAVDPRVLPIGEADVPRTVELVYGLAEYEKAPGQCHLTARQLRDALFGPNPAVYGLAAFTGPEPDAPQAGVALYFLSFSTWEGVHGIYLVPLSLCGDAVAA
jgi:hypothetical protein